MTDRLVRGVTEDGRWRFAAALTTDTCLAGVAAHGGSAAAARALATGLTCSALLAVSEKDFHRISVQWRGDGPLRTVQTDVRPSGTLRGFVGSNLASGKTVSAVLGSRGQISVVESDPKGRVARGTRELVDGSVVGDLQGYLELSEQVPTLLRVFLQRNDRGRPAAVAGLLLQPLPGDAERGRGFPVCAAARDSSLRVCTPEELLAAAMPGVGLKLLAEQPLAWGCECSVERVERAVRLLEVDELSQMVHDEEPARVHCEFCNTDYEVSVPRLAELRDEKAAG